LNQPGYPFDIVLMIYGRPIDVFAVVSIDESNDNPNMRVRVGAAK
jgi:hypothetical protein